MSVVTLFLVLVFVQVTDSANSPGANKFCLSCQGILNLRACTHFVEVWRREVCTTERVVLQNGTTIWNLGYEDGICQGSEVIHTRQVRTRRDPERGIVVCHECCQTDLCNHRLCGSTLHNTLACLENDTNVAYCNQGELCYVSQLCHSRPGDFQYACVSQVMCRQILSGNIHAMCQRCCGHDGCNMHACSSNSSSGSVYSDCWDLRNRGRFTQDGVYDIYPPPGNSRIRVRCDMQTNGGGWTVIFRRYDGSLSFVNRTFNDYATGFGEPSGELFFSLDHLHQLTSHSSPLTLRVDLCSRRYPNRPSLYGEYEMFSIGSRNDRYRLHVGRYHGTAVDRMHFFNSAEFTFTHLCPLGQGAWWHSGNVCYFGLTGVNYTTGVYWGGPNLAAEMKIRPMFVNGSSTLFTCPG